MQNFQYNFNVGGNYSAEINNITSATGKFSASVDGAMSTVTKLAGKFAVFDLASSYMSKFDSTIQSLSTAGITLDSQMHDLSAVAGVTGKGLKEIEGYARESAQAFGTDAGVAVEGYKLLLSQLTPELAKCPEALKAMGNSIQTTSKLMGNDGVAAAEVLTTAMNQYGVSLDDPLEASRKMADMMNVMAAAGQAGSAELPAIKSALEQCGMAAKSANVSFEETNAAIQVLDKAGKKGSEGGVALRNTLAILGQGRFLPKDTREALEAAGINVLKLGDKSLTLKERLDMLKPIMKDSALFSKLFGMENANAARALVQGSDQIKAFQDQITGTKSAEKQAAVVMDSYAERQARVQQRFEDMKISIFQATGDLSIWVGTLTSALVPLSQLMPLIQGVGSVMASVKGLQWASMWSRIRRFVFASRLQMAFMNRELITGQFASNGFMLNITRATLAVLRFGTVGILQGIKALGAFLLSLVTSGGASATFAGIASASFSAFKLSAVTACRAVGIAIMSIPIIGWVAAAIAALIALGVYFWNTSVKFRAVLKGLWAAFKTAFTGIGLMAKQTFGAIGDLIKAAFKLDTGGISAALNRLKGTYSDFGKKVGQAFSEAYNAEIKAGEKKNASKKGAKAQASAVVPVVEQPKVPDVTGGTAGNTKSKKHDKSGDSSSESGSKIKNITINVDRLVERIEIHTANMKEGAERIKDVVAEALLSALNDTNLATD